MVMDTTTPSRIDRIKRRQAAALAGSQRAAESPAADTTTSPRKERSSTASAPVPVPVKPQQMPTAPSKDDHVGIADTDSLDMISHIDVLGAEELRADFVDYLDAIANVHSYGETDKKFISDYFMPTGIDLVGDPVARRNLKDRIRGWQVDLITFGWVPPPGKERMEHRARTTFRQEVMGMEVDENGIPYPGVAAKQFIQAAKRSSSIRP